MCAYYREYYQEYKMTRIVTGICPKCGKMAKRTISASQILNSFNKDAENKIKSVSQIMEENAIKLNDLEKNPVYHAKCEN